MIVFNLISRPTRDVDILEILQPKLEDTDEPQLPSEIRGLVAEIGREFDIKDDWLNFGPARCFGSGCRQAFWSEPLVSGTANS
ncbi:MAG TPA: hypothetical protein VIS96_13380 [Terrimicrobiaceae bacterium]